MKKTVLFILFVCSVLLNLSGKDIYFKHLSNAEGLSQPSAISICQDSLGNIWFGNDILNKFDGNTTTSYRLSDFMDSIQNINVKQILHDNENRLFILANTKLIIYNLKLDKFTKTNIEAEFIYLKNNQIYFAQQNVVYSFNPEDNTTRIVFEMPDKTVTVKTISIFEKDKIWIGTTNGLYVVNNKDIIHTVLEDVNISCVFRDSKKDTWIGTVDSGIRIIDKETGNIRTLMENKPLSPECRLSHNNIRCINEDNKENIWIGTFGGITIYSLVTHTSSFVLHNEYSYYTLPHNSVYSIFKDRQGTMWVGTYYGGVSYFNPSVELYNYYGTSQINRSMLSGFIIGNITEDNENNLYIATEEGGINYFNRHTGEIKRYDKANGFLPHNTIKSIWYDKEYNRLYAGTFTEGLLVKENNSNQFNSIGKGVFVSLNQRIISQIVPYDKEYVIVVTQNGIYKINRRTQAITIFSNMPEFNYDNTGIIHNLFVDTDGTIWVSSVKKGLFYVKPQTGEVRYFDMKDLGDKIKNALITKIQAGKDNKIYFLCQNGLLIYDKGQQSLNYINTDKGLLLSNICINMAILASGNIVITSDKGITLYKPFENESVHLPLAKIFPLKSINGSCGLYVSPANDDIYIGGMGGMLTLSESDINIMGASDQRSYNLFFSLLSVNNEIVKPSQDLKILKEDISYTDQINLNYRQSNISITFASSDYMHMNSIVYEYLLEDFDKQWTITRDKVIRYTSLPPGNYKLKVRESTKKDNFIELSIHIKPPFYASTIAYIIYTLMALALLYYIIHFMQKNALLRASLKLEHKEKLQIAELNKMKLNFFTNISHEFRTPLTLISSQLDILLKNKDISQSLKGKFLKIKKHTRELQLLINELMHFNKLEQGTFPVKVSRQDITEFLNDIYLAFKDHAQVQNITFSFDHADEDIEVWFDPIQLQKVIYNLLSNAFKFTKENGEVRMGLKRKKDYIEITVKDNGIGIKESDLEKIFDRFYQVNNKEFSTQWMEGMGIGLALSKNIIKQHSGELLVDSKIGEMTCFTVNLLLGDAHFSEAQKDTWSTGESMYITNSQVEDTEDNNGEKELYIEDKSKANVLIIEDNEELMQLLTDAFSPIYNVKVAYDGETGLNMALETKPDLVLSDIMIPRLSGLEVCKRIKTNAITSHIPVILITARSSAKQNKEGLQYGADDYIIKPFDLELLLLKCNNLVKNRKELQQKFQGYSSTITQENAGMATNGADQRFLDDSLNVLESNLANTEFDTNIWAKEMSIGRSKLFNRIKEITGHTPNEYLINFKMKKAEKLLKDELSMTVSEIAYSLGFSSPGYFNKCFKEQFGMTPSQFRKGDYIK